MKKLQLYIFKSLKGFKCLRSFNADEEVQGEIREMRSALETLDYDPAEKYLFYAVSYIESGALFTILRTIPDKPADHLATVIFVPNDVVVTTLEMADVVKRTARVISNQAVTSDDLAELGHLFAREYPTDTTAPALLPSTGYKYGYSLFGSTGGRQLSDYLGEQLYKPEYAAYSAVLLVDEMLGVECSAVDVDKTAAPVAAAAVEAPVEAPVPAVVEKVEEPAAALEPQAETVKAEAKPAARPAVKSLSRRLADARAKVYRFELPMKVAQLGAPIRFEIRSKSEIFESPIEGYKLIDDIQEGAGRMNHLDFEGRLVGISKHIAIAMTACALLLGLLLGFLIWGGSSNNEAAPVAEETEQVAATDSVAPAAEPIAVAEPAPAAEEKTEEPKNVEIKVNEPAATTAASVSMTAAVTYLEDNSNWKRAEMEKIPGLEGLFDDMNNFRYERLSKHWGPILKDSKYFQKVIHHVENGRGKDRPAEGQTFTSKNSIARYGYCCTVDK